MDFQHNILTGQNEYPQEFAIHRQLAQADLLLELVWMHAIITLEIISHLLQNYELEETNPEELTQATLLHDVGAYLCSGFEWIPNQPPSQYPYIQHGLIGEQVLQKLGYPEHICRTCSHHAGVGFSKKEITKFKLLLPPQDFFPETELEKLITYASKFHSKTPRMRTAEQIKDSLEKFGKDKVKKFEELESTFGKPSLEPIKEKYCNWHKRFCSMVEPYCQHSTLHLSPTGMSGKQ